MPQTQTTPEPNDQVHDAVKGNWVDHLAPAWSRPYLRLSRADRPIGTWLLLLPCWWGLFLGIQVTGTATWYDAWIFIACALGAFLMRGAGCTWNDITDREFDGAVERTKSRPIPSGQVTVKGAAVWMVVQALIAFCILLTFNTTAILLGFLSTALVAIYPFAKRFTWWPQVFLGLAFNWGALLVFAAHTGTVHAASLTLYLAGIAWTLFYDTIYAHQDKEDDALIGVKSTARLFAENTKIWIFGFASLSAVLIACAVFLTPLTGLAQTIALLGPVTYWAHMMWQLNRLDIDDPEGCMMLFRANRDTGLLIVLFFACASIL